MGTLQAKTSQVWVHTSRRLPVAVPWNLGTGGEVLRVMAVHRVNCGTRGVGKIYREDGDNGPTVHREPLEQRCTPHGSGRLTYSTAGLRYSQK